MEMAELAFVPTSASGHLAPLVELAKVLTSRTNCISATIFIMQLPFESKIDPYIQTLLSNQPSPRMHFVHLTLDESTTENLRFKPMGSRITELVQINKSRVKDFYSNSESAQHVPPTAFVVDGLCTAFADVANDFGVPTYVFCASNACFLGLWFYLQSIHDHDQNRDITEFKHSYTELSVPGFVNPVPSTVLPHSCLDKEDSLHGIFFDAPRQIRKAKGILVNTFVELEPYAIKCLSEDNMLPPIYTVGPILDLKAEANNEEKEIIMWLDNQPRDSVVFLCFGSMGTLQAEQVARALEICGHRFLWSLRHYLSEGKVEPSEYEILDGVLPEGFLDRTKEVGKVIGWAPQVAVLSNSAVGGFVFHCGWNSIIESLWCGVPVATWPLYSEQQMNAFEMVKELGLAFEMKIDYQMENPVTLSAAEIGCVIIQLMNKGMEIRKKVTAMSEKSRMAVVEGGSSYSSVGHFITKVLNSST